MKPLWNVNPNIFLNFNPWNIPNILKLLCTHTYSFVMLFSAISNHETIITFYFANLWHINNYLNFFPLEGICLKFRAIVFEAVLHVFSMHVFYSERRPNSPTGQTKPHSLSTIYNVSFTSKYQLWYWGDFISNASWRKFSITGNIFWWTSTTLFYP